MTVAGPIIESKPRKTREAWNVAGHAHFLTYSCFKRLPLLTTDRSRHWVMEALEKTRLEQNIAIYAFVIMPEHVHLVVNPLNPTYEMRRVLAAVKRPVSDAARNYLTETANKKWLETLTVRYPSRTVFRFWQPGGGFDHNIFQEKTLQAVVTYVHENPVRRGLCSSSSDWLWSSARFWERLPGHFMVMDHPNA